MHLIDKLQPLDIGESVDAIGTDSDDNAQSVKNVVCDRSHAAHGIHAVVGSDVGEHGRVEGVARGSGVRRRRQDLTDDLELAGVIGPVEHERDHRFQAVEAGDLGARSIGIRPHANAHVQPFVAVDDVVAAAAFDDVAAAAAEDDVAGTERGDTCAKQVLKPVDQGDASGIERAVLRADDVDHGRVGIIAAQDVALRRSRQAFHLGKPVKQALIGWRHRRFYEVVDQHVDGHAERIVLVAGPVETAAAAKMVLAVGEDHDVVAAFAVGFIEATAGDEDVITDDRACLQRGKIVAGGTIRGADFDPVVARVAEGGQVHLRAEDEVVAMAAEGRRNVLAGDDEVAAVAAEQYVEAVAALNDVVAGIALEDVVAATVGDDVVAVATLDLVVAGATFEPVVAGVAVERVIADAGDDDVIAGGAAEDHMVFAGVAQVIAVGAHRGGIVPNHQRNDGGATQWIIPAQKAKTGELQRLSDLKGKGRCREDVGRQVLRVGVEHHQL